MGLGGVSWAELDWIGLPFRIRPDAVGCGRVRLVALASECFVGQELDLVELGWVGGGLGWT